MSTNNSLPQHEDVYDHYLFENEKHFQAGNGGKQRTKVEVALNSNRQESNGQNRKIVTLMANTEKNRNSSK
ncbi:unnamed protein product [Didymodactylos carnosus]|uniref:Nuclear protein 1 n=1 Tax=Didymodactylos carnosus TaxID=1234261 RepID=A0A814FJ15_9BILA|nr:unnamed protein product [Didymodactylos carnosus]CAF3753281.1 unnamed protein product [Didymodactylos carnosus]